MVGAARFELATPYTPCRCPTGLGHAPTRRLYHEPDPPLGTPAGPPMKRIYARATSGTHEGIGYLCEGGHVVLDAAPEMPDNHALTPTSPVTVICQLDGQ